MHVCLILGGPKHEAITLITVIMIVSVICQSTASDKIWETTFRSVLEDGKTVDEGSEVEFIRSKFVAIATGHHAKPSMVKFLGQDSFKGTVI